jgi:hypothetical protein
MTSLLNSGSKFQREGFVDVLIGVLADFANSKAQTAVVVNIIAALQNSILILRRELFATIGVACASRLGTLRKSKTDDRVLRVHAIDTPLNYTAKLLFAFRNWQLLLKNGK